MKVMFIMLAFALAVVAGLAFDHFRKHSRYCVEIATITGIGGCDRNGLCGISLSNGTSDTDFYPVVGEKVCVKREGEE